MAEKTVTLQARRLSPQERKKIRRNRALWNGGVSAGLSGGMAGAMGSNLKTAGLATGFGGVAGGALGAAMPVPKNTIEIAPRSLKKNDDASAFGVAHVSKGVSMSTTPIRLVPVRRRPPPKPSPRDVLSKSDRQERAGLLLAGAGTVGAATGLHRAVDQPIKAMSWKQPHYGVRRPLAVGAGATALGGGLYATSNARKQRRRRRQESRSAGSDAQVRKSYDPVRLEDSAFAAEVSKGIGSSLRAAQMSLKPIGAAAGNTARQFGSAVNQGAKAGWKAGKTPVKVQGQGASGAVAGIGARLQGAATGAKTAAAPGLAAAKQSATAVGTQARAGWNGAKTSTKIGIGAAGAGAVGGGSYYAGSRRNR